MGRGASAAPTAASTRYRAAGCGTPFRASMRCSTGRGGGACSFTELDLASAATSCGCGRQLSLLTVPESRDCFKLGLVGRFPAFGLAGVRLAADARDGPGTRSGHSQWAHAVGARCRRSQWALAVGRQALAVSLHFQVTGDSAGPTSESLR